MGFTEDPPKPPAAETESCPFVLFDEGLPIMQSRSTRAAKAAASFTNAIFRKSSARRAALAAAVLATGISAHADVVGARRVALIGDAAPDTSGLTFGAFGLDLFNNPGISINNNGRVSFAARLAGTGVVTGTNDFGFFAGATLADLRLTLRQGDAAPGTSA